MTVSREDKIEYLKINYKMVNHMDEYCEHMPDFENKSDDELDEMYIDCSMIK